MRQIKAVRTTLHYVQPAARNGLVRASSVCADLNLTQTLLAALEGKNQDGGCFFRVAKSRSPWRGGVVRPLVWPIAVEWPLLEVQRSVSSQDVEWQLPAPAVIGTQILTGRRQSWRNIRPVAATVRTWPGRSVRCAFSKRSPARRTFSVAGGLLAWPGTHAPGQELKFAADGNWWPTCFTFSS